MDIPTLTTQLVPFLAPFLPYLLKMGERAAEEAGERLGAVAWEKAKALWGKLRPKVEAKPAAQEATRDLAAAPQDDDAQAALRLQLKKLLQEDEALAAEIARLWGEAQAAGATVTAAGNRSVAIGGNVSGSVIVTGYKNKIEYGDMLSAYSPLPGLLTPPPARKYVCPQPECSYTRRLQKAGGQPGACPHHGLPLIPAEQKARP